MKYPKRIDLAGTWHMAMAPEKPGVYEHTIQLPGSLQAQGFGDAVTLETPWTGQIVDRSFFTDARYAPYRKPGKIKIPFWLQPETYFRGKAWYQRTIDIPADWEGKRVVLSLERPHIQTTCWLDGRELGSRDTLAAPHVYELGTRLAAGAHTLTLCVDNQVHVDVGENAHSITDHTQSNWNGIVGRMTLEATAPVWIDEVQAYPNVAERSVRLVVRLGNATGRPGQGTLTLQENSFPADWSVEGGRVEITRALGAEVALWDEFSPVLHSLNLRLVSAEGAHERIVTFGLREVGTHGTQITLNGRKIFLRGTLECAVFPLTGTPPTEETEWQRILGLVRAYGFNHVRFHSWCPPEAAFAVADVLGLYLQIECSSWAQRPGLGLGTPLDEWLYREAREIIRAYGNHPSFLLMAYGNEPSGKTEMYLGNWVDHWKKEEPRRLHTSGAGWPALTVNDYDNIPEPRIQVWGDGLTSGINAMAPGTAWDHTIYVAEKTHPIVSHEIGQWCVYPDFSEIPKYTGPLKARNFEIFRETLEANHMGDQAVAFVQASGKLQILCYRDDLEAALRTPGFGGYQILQMNDFPGQGTALVGWMNPFWESKGYVTAKEFRRFNNSTVLLARLDRRVFTPRAALRAELEVAHFEARPMENAQTCWQLVGEDGTVHRSGRLPPRTLPVDNGIPLGTVECSLAGLPAPAKYRLVAGLEGTEVENDWELWLYPETNSARAQPDVHLIRDWSVLLDQADKEKKVLFVPPERYFDKSVKFGFSSIFWNTAWSRKQPPHTLGILCDPAHAVFSGFPTESHSNWQWWELISSSSVLQLDGLPPDLRPLVQVIDDWFTNRRLGLLFEARLGRCQVMVTGMELLGGIQSRHVARQMRRSILDYMKSSKFAPSHALDPSTLKTVFGGGDVAARLV